MDTTLTGMVATLDLAPGIYRFENVTITPAIVASQVILQSGSSVSATFFESTPITVADGGPPTTFRAITFRRSILVPALQVTQAEATVEDCIFENNSASAIQVSGTNGMVYIRRSLLSFNGQWEASGRRLQSLSVASSALVGGAISAVAGGAVELDHSVVSNNSAAFGGAIALVGVGSKAVVRGSNITNNQATIGGGGLHINGGLLILSEKTLLAGNSAPSGGGLMFSAGSFQYALPVPLGHWAPNVRLCDAAGVIDPAVPYCTVETLGMALSTITPGAMEEDFPYTCAAGLLGENDLIDSQDGPDCSGYCPAGTYCPKGSVTPKVCPEHFYCEVGSPAPIPCPDGYYGPTGQVLGSIDECLPCEPGFYCQVGVRTPCGEVTYNPFWRANNRTACERCPDYSSSFALNSTSREACKCVEGFYDDRDPFDASFNSLDAQCKRCISGTNCNKTTGVTLLTLPIKRGFWRPSQLSRDVRRCPDSPANCTEATEGSVVCVGTSSGCHGGTDFNTSCNPGLGGAFCQLCDPLINDNSTRMNYIPATKGKAAHCEPCEDTLGITVAAFTLIGSCLILGTITAIVFARLALLQRIGTIASSSHRQLVRATRPGNKIKICLGFYIIVCKIHSVYDIALPPFVQELMYAINVLLSLGLEELLTPFDCLGLGMYLVKLLFWMLLAPVGVIVLFGLIRVWMHFTMRFTWREFGERALSLGVKLLFLFYPIISTIAFEAFACHEFEGIDKWLIVDVSVDCSSEYYLSTVYFVAWVAVAIYPIGTMILCGFMLSTAREAIVKPADPASAHLQWLARGLRFMYGEYKPELYWWEIVEMLRRFILVGIFVDVYPGNVIQIVTATSLSIFFLFMQLTVQPYHNSADGFLAATCSFFLTTCFASAAVLKYNTLVEVQQQDSLLSLEQQADFVHSSSTLALTFLVSTLGSLPVVFGILAYEISAEREKQRQEARGETNSKLRYVANDREVKLPPITASQFHVFLSHVWGTGQDQMRIVKQRLREMMPSARIFLDVDDLREGKGAEYVDASLLTLVFCSGGYFRSQNCMRELLAAVALGKPMITVIELEWRHGGIDEETVLSELQIADERYLKQWGDANLGDEVATWLQEWEMSDAGRMLCERLVRGEPIAQGLHCALFKSWLGQDQNIIEWNRLGAFQNVTLQLIAEAFLPPDVRGKTYVKASELEALTAPPPRHSWRYLLYCSPNNPRAADFVRELADNLDTGSDEQDSALTLKGVALKLFRQMYSLVLCAFGCASCASARRDATSASPLHVTEDPAEAQMAERFFVYLTCDTWTSGEKSEAFAAEVEAAMRRGAQLLLCHEMPGVGGEARHAEDFGNFFKDTPSRLIRDGIYSQIALPLKGGAWRRVSLSMVTSALAQDPGPPSEEASKLLAMAAAREEDGRVDVAKRMLKRPTMLRGLRPMQPSSTRHLHTLMERSRRRIFHRSKRGERAPSGDELPASLASITMEDDKLTSGHIGQPPSPFVVPLSERITDPMSPYWLLNLFDAAPPSRGPLPSLSNSPDRKLPRNSFGPRLRVAPSCSISPESTMPKQMSPRRKGQVAPHLSPAATPLRPATAPPDLSGSPPQPLYTMNPTPPSPESRPAPTRALSPVARRTLLSRERTLEVNTLPPVTPRRPTVPRRLAPTLNAESLSSAAHEGRDRRAGLHNGNIRRPPHRPAPSIQSRRISTSVTPTALTSAGVVGRLRE